MHPPTAHRTTPPTFPISVLQVFFVIALLMPCVVRAQTPPAIQWQQSFGGSSSDGCGVVKQTSDGGYILGGSSYSDVSGNKTSTNYGSSDYWVIKLDASGNKVWENSFGSSGTGDGFSGDDGLTTLQQTSDGGYILGGFSTSGVSGNKTSGNYGSSDYWIIKLDGSGNKVWENSFGGDNYDQLTRLQQTSDGGYILGGYSYSGVSGNRTSENYGNSDYWVIKLNGNGNIVWDKSFGGSSDDLLRNLQQTSDGGYILGGYSYSVVSGNKTSGNYGRDDYWVIKLDASGNKVWEKSFGGSNYDELYSLQQTSDNGFILGGDSISGVSGNKTSTNYGNYDYWVIKLDASGNKVWEKSFGGSAGDSLSSMQQTSGDGYILGGSSGSGVSGNKTSANYGNNDYWVIKLDASGNKVWENSFGGSGDAFSGSEQLYSLQQTSDGGYILGGNSDSFVSGNKTSADYGGGDYWVVKLAGANPPRPTIEVLNGLGFSSGQFGFNITGSAGQTVVIEGSTNLTNWIPLQTNTLGNTPIYFSDPKSNTAATRYYRLRTP